MDQQIQPIYPPGHPNNKKVLILISIFAITTIFAVASVFITKNRIKQKKPSQSTSKVATPSISAPTTKSFFDPSVYGNLTPTGEMAKQALPPNTPLNK